MFNWFCWHKWKYVYEPYPTIFLGETYDRLDKKFRICRKCGKAQQLCITYDGLWWEPLGQTETEILKRKIIDKGDYYVLRK